METLPEENQKIACRLILRSSSEHLTQLMTGFGILNKNGLINVHLERDTDYYPGNGGPQRLKAIINDQFKIIYDMRDSDAVHADDLRWADFYFKRSFNPKIHKDSSTSRKIFSLGLNYSAYGSDDFSYIYLKYGFKNVNNLMRSFQNQKDLIERVLRSNSLLSRLFKRTTGKGVAHYSMFEGQPLMTNRPLILFFTRLWEPYRSSPDMDEMTFHERQKMNELRINCIYALKEKYNNQFFGGLVPNQYAIATYPDLVADKSVTYRSNYTKMIHTAAICISTSGLWGSNSWKMGEFVAGAKAIVLEKLKYSVPGDFLPNKNYLEFENSDQCISNVEKLVNEPEFRYQMMLNNLRYYYEYLRPDRLVWNSLNKVLGC